MNVNPPFFLRENYSEGVLSLLNAVTLGSNGTRYRHRNIDERITQLYRPLFLNLERNERVIGNVTMCRRDSEWYVRYFAFHPKLQTIKKIKKRSSATKNLLKSRINTFFDKVFAQESAPNFLYAYVDPRNERSLWMSQNFGFYTAAKIASQTFSRIRPKRKNDVQKASELEFIKKKIKQTYSENPLFFDHHTFNDSPFYELKKDGEVVAFAKIHSAEWVIERLSGKSGHFLINIIPYVPGVRKVVRPAAHKFTVVDSVWAKGNSPKYLEELYEGILEKEKKNTLVWWVDVKEPLYQTARKGVNWGLLHKINGCQEVDLVIRNADKEKSEFTKPTYVTGFDFI